MSTTTTPPVSPKDLKIAIIGSGPVSLTLASLLTAYTIPYTLYEASTAIRHQGGSLDLHPATGQQALREAGLWDAFCKYARPESDVLRLVEPGTGEIVWDENEAENENTHSESTSPENEAGKEGIVSKEGVGRGDGGRPEIDRARLVQILHESLPEHTVQFGKKLVSATSSSSSTPQRPQYDLHFADGTDVTAVDLLVGGDGAWSAVRRLLSPTTPSYSGISALEVWVNDTGLPENEWASNYVGAGSMFAFGEKLAVQAQRQGDGGLRTYASLQVPEDFLETCGIDWSVGNKDQARMQWVETYFGHVSPDLRRLVKESRDETVPRKLYELPVGWTWPHKAGVTLIGDAAHVMTPFAGVGVNVGMTDALVLAKQIKEVWNEKQGLNEGIEAYEGEMFPRAEKNALKTAKNKKRHFSEGGARHMADMLKSMKGGAGH